MLSIRTLCHYAQCRVLFAVTLNLIMLIVIMLNLIMLNVFTLYVIMLEVNKLPCGTQHNDIQQYCK